MSNVTGQTSAMPGTAKIPPTDTMCDDHPFIVAYRRVTIEVDSFGSEETDLCEKCFKNFQEEFDKKVSGSCEWCKQESDDIRFRRDRDEGTTGRLYDVCPTCRDRQDRLIREEAECPRDDDSY